MLEDKELINDTETVEEDNGKEVAEIKVTYTDGTEEVIEKGTVITLEEKEDGTETILFRMCGFSGKDLTKLMVSILSAGDQMGIFDGLESEGEN